MIIEFSVANYRSVKDIQTFNMSAANIVSKYKEVDITNTIKISDKLTLLKSKAIYGANASGKSNLIKAFQTFIIVIQDSVKDSKVLRNRIEPFKLSTETENLPSFFQLIFVVNNVQYRYGFEVTRDEIVSEWLMGTPGKKEVPFFTREGKIISVNENKFREGIKIRDLYSQPENDIARNNSLFLTTVRSFGGLLSGEIINYLSEIFVITGLSDFKMYKAAEDYIAEDKNLSRISEFLKVADVGIDQIKRFEYQDKDDHEAKTYTLTYHKKFGKDLESNDVASLFMLIDESEGTKKMFEIGPFVIEALKRKKVLLFDEFDARFHPVITKKLVELFNSEANQGSQLIFATHDTNLLHAKLLRRDQVCFVEKDKYGSSHFYTLVDFKGVRNDSSFEKDYISGRYGAIPFVGDFNSVISD